MALVTKRIASPVGRLKLVASDKGLVAILWENDRPSRVRLGELVEQSRHPMLEGAEAQLADYFAGLHTRFDMPLDMAGTDFQRSVWAALATIPFGETRTYGALAAEIGRPTASRAIGAACGRNPVSIIVPCHRAVGATGALTGFAGGLDTKEFLLKFEGHRHVAAGRLTASPESSYAPAA